MEKGRTYIAISKVGYDKTTKSAICVKYRFNNIDNFLIFINKKFPSVCWINIYYRKGINKNRMAYTWGKNKGLRLAF